MVGKAGSEKSFTGQSYHDCSHLTHMTYMTYLTF